MAAEAPVRYAVIGLGHIAQVAILPAFDNAENSVLTAVVSGSEEKRKAMAEKYGLEHAVDYDDLEDLLRKDVADAVYVTVPNHLHREYTVRAARAGAHVLCEKPMAVTEDECEAMMEACAEHDRRLMVAYRLHFEKINMEVAERVRGGAIGEPRFFASSFSQKVVEGDVRLMPIEKGGGSVYDMGIYCINAARYVFGDEPVEVTAFSARRDGDARFDDCDEMTSATLRFPGDRLATFTSSFGAHAVSRYRIQGTEGEVVVDPAYGYATSLAWEMGVDGDRRRKELGKRDQFAPELIHFSACVRSGEDPEPDGIEGLNDVAIVRAVYRSAREGSPVRLDLQRRRRPGLDQVMRRPGFPEPEVVATSGPSED